MKERMEYLIGLDIGTSSVKGVLIAADGSSRRTGRQEFVYDRSESGHVEIPAERYIAACFALLRQLAEQLPAGARLAGISAASASGNLLLLGADGTPCTPIFNWQDRRTEDEVDRVLPGLDLEAYRRSTGWRFDRKTFPLAALCRYAVREPELLAACSMVCMSTEYLYWRLTGKWGIGPSAGTPFYLIDQTSRTYRADILSALGIPTGKLPPILPTGSVLGAVTADAAAMTGIPAGTPVVIGTFDHPSAARGVGVVREGQLLLSCGTSWVGLYPINERARCLDAGMLADPFLSESGGPWAGMVSLASVSGKLEWYVRRFVADEGDIYGTLVSLAAQGDPGAGGLAVDPTKEPDEERIRSFPKPQVARAVMEGTVRLLAERLHAVAASGVRAEEAVMVGGPSERPLWARLIAEQTGLKVRVMHGAFAGAVGAAMLAGIAAGIWDGCEDAFASLKEQE